MDTKPNEGDEVTLTLASIEDETEFEEQWMRFTVDMPFFLAYEADYKRLAKVWFGKGIERGTNWMMSEIEKEIGDGD